MTWYFNVTSIAYGKDIYGPYDTKKQAQQGIKSVRAKAAELQDGIEREFSAPYKPKNTMKVVIEIACPESEGPINNVKAAARLLDAVVSGSIAGADVSLQVVAVQD
jgi:hypothetical protein